MTTCIASIYRSADRGLAGIVGHHRRGGENPSDGVRLSAGVQSLPSFAGEWVDGSGLTTGLVKRRQWVRAKRLTGETMRERKNQTNPLSWCPPLQARKPGIVAIECDPFAAGFDGQGGKPGIRNEVTPCICLNAQTIENNPMVFAGLNDQAMGLIHNDAAKSKCLVKAARHGEYSRVCRDANHSAKDLRCHAETGFTVDHAVEPRPADLVFGRVHSKGMHKNVDVGENHGAFMTSSRSTLRFRSTPGKTPPEALETGNKTLLRPLAFGSAKMRVNPSSTSDVKVRPSSAARFLARFNRSSRILMVVLMH